MTAPVVGLAPVSAALRSVLLKGRGTVLMLHRFDCPDRGVRGHDPSQLRTFLERLRRERRELISLREMFRRLAGRGPDPDGALTFTIDDGYAEHAEIAAPIFAEYDCPLTIFVTTGFLDGSMWFWWDQIEYVISTAKASEKTLEELLPGIGVGHGAQAGRRHAVRALITACKDNEPAARDDLIGALARSLDIQIPEHAPPKYAPMSWETLRVAESTGTSFGPHTVTHPILNRCSDEQSAREIRDSWLRLKSEASDPDPVFCYPDGEPGSFSEREISVLRNLNLVGAVSASPGYASVSDFGQDADYRFRLPRFGYSQSRSIQTHLLSGFERIWESLRGEP